MTIAACSRLTTIRSVNISNANVFGLSEELNITEDNKYNIALVIFFVPYILFEIPSNILLKKLKPRVWLSLCMFGFGLGKHSHQWSTMSTLVLTVGSDVAARPSAELLRSAHHALLPRCV